MKKKKETPTYFWAALQEKGDEFDRKVDGLVGKKKEFFAEREKGKGAKKLTTRARAYRRGTRVFLAFGHKGHRRARGEKKYLENLFAWGKREKKKKQLHRED